MNLFFLQLFAEGGDGAPAAEGQGVTGEPAQPTEPSADPNAEFEALIRGKYKDQYDSRVQSTIHKRLKGSRETAQRLQTLTPALNLLAQHYGVAEGDAEALVRAVQGDDSLLRAEADRRGMDVRTLRSFQSLEQENARLQQERFLQNREAHIRSQYALWQQQADAAKETYPELDMNAESQNPQFRQLLHQGLDVASAYLLIHREEILERNAKEVEQRIAGRMMTAATRPSENGSAAQSSAVTRTDPAAMTRRERDAIRRRAARGEKIRF